MDSRGKRLSVGLTLDREEWRRGVTQRVHTDAGWLKVKVMHIMSQLTTDYCRQQTVKTSYNLRFFFVLHNDHSFLANVKSSSCSLCRHPSVCLSSVCRLSVTFVRRTQAIDIFRTFSSPFGTLAICWHSGKILRRSSHGNPSVRGVKHNGGSQI